MTSSPPPPFGTIIGTVTNVSNGEPISGVAFQIKGGYKATSNDEGNFTFFGVPEGSHAMKARADGFSTAIQEFTVGAGETVRVDFDLVADDGGGGGPPKKCHPRKGC